MSAKNKKENKKYGSRSSNAEVTQRITIIITMILRGFSRREILQNTSKMGWNVSDRSIDTYIKKAYNEIKKESERNRECEFGKAMGRLNKLYERLYASKQYTACLGTQREINKLSNLYESSEADDNRGAVERWLNGQK